MASNLSCFEGAVSDLSFFLSSSLVAHDCGYPLSRYTCRATRVAADFLDFIAFSRCSTGVRATPPKNSGVAPPPPCLSREVSHPEIWLPEKVSRYTGVSQLQLRVSRYTVQLFYHQGAAKGGRLKDFLITFFGHLF